VVLNGGLITLADCNANLPRFDGVMLGRSPWHDPSVLARISHAWWPQLPTKTEADLIEALVNYAAMQVAESVPLRLIARPLLGLFNGRPNSRKWRQMLSDSKLLKQENPELIRLAWQQVGGNAVDG
jgi:tRNA-dihydrouridine synthase A